MNKQLITLPSPDLRERSKKIGLISSDVADLISNMETVTLEWEDSRDHEVGVALAAVQIGVLQRAVVIRKDFNDKQNREFKVFINPEITKYEGEIVYDYEGCLSVKDIYGHVPRYSKVRVKAIDEHGKEVRTTAEGFLARVFQHEIDHTNGIVFVDRIHDDEEAFFVLDDDGKLSALDYETEIKNNEQLWQTE